jgi:alkanesulfonate monooxygenase SsuD/methylene tetrahydromethanopterin reductase-like flavin-dependent oxidoreductase (luciferase family)
MAYDPERIHRIEYEGRFHRLSATGQTHPSPQRVPALFQAGTSKSGIALAGAHAEGLFCGSLLPEHTAKYVKNIRDSAAAAGRDPGDVKAFAGMSIFLGRTHEEAQAKYDAAAKNVSPVAGLAKFSGYTNIDMSKYPLDEPFVLDTSHTPSDNVIQGIITSFQSAAASSKEVWTPRKLGSKIALGGLYPIAIGTPEEVADFLEEWTAATDVDGFNVYCRFLSHRAAEVIITLTDICPSRLHATRIVRGSCRNVGTGTAKTRCLLDRLSSARGNSEREPEHGKIFATTARCAPCWQDPEGKRG